MWSHTAGQQRCHCSGGDRPPYRVHADPRERTYAVVSLGQFNPLKLFTDPALKTRRAENEAARFSRNWRATKVKDAA
jgi:hypothetical protein